MSADLIVKYFPQCTVELWSELYKKLKDNNLSILTVNSRNITGKSVYLTINLKLVRKRFTFIIITEYQLTFESQLPIENNGHTSHTIISVSRTG